MTNILSPTPKLKFFGNDSKPAVGYKLFTYEAGTNTKAATYPDENTGVPNSNPIVLDFRGECNLWVPPNVAYKYVFATPTDTDPPTNPIWSVDDIVESQLLTLYGGVDTGSANAYALNFVANFTSYTDGLLIYWVPSHTNTTASTINVNGLGPVAILNQDGSTLIAGQIAANQISAIIYRGSGFRLLASQIDNIFGGTSTGVANAYVLPAPQFSSYHEGLLIYWAPNVSNDGLADVTIDVNGLGTVSIRNVDGSLLSANQLVANQIVGIISNGAYFTLITPTIISGSFTVTLSGVTGTVTGTAYWTRSGKSVSIVLPNLAGTSNATLKSYTSLPVGLSPAIEFFGLSTGINNGAAAEEVIRIRIAALSSLVSFSRLTADGLWTNSGACSISGGTISYQTP